MVWPSPQDYNEAIQSPQISFFDEELRAATAEMTNLGLPRCITGAFASVYHMTLGNKEWAVRCFLRQVEDRKERYARISKFVMSDDLPETVNFDFIERGLRVHGDWYPILKMDWVNGETIGNYVKKNINRTQVLSQLERSLVKMYNRLHACGIAHGDLQHDNLMLVGDELRLVDYDGMFVPSLAGLPANELGHRNYQHPCRQKRHFGPYLDHFSEWVIALSLRCLSEDPEVWEQVKGGDDCMLFRHSDFISALQSPVFALLERHESAEIRRASRRLRSIISLPVEEVPPISTELPEPHVPDLPGVDGGKVWLVEQSYKDPVQTSRQSKTAVITPEKAVRFIVDLDRLPTLSESFNANEKSVAECVDLIDREFMLSEVSASGYPKLSAAQLLGRLVPLNSEISQNIRAQLATEEHLIWKGGLKAELQNPNKVLGDKGTTDWMGLIISIWAFVILVAIACGPWGFALLPFALLIHWGASSLCKSQSQSSYHYWYGVTNGRLIIVQRTSGRWSWLGLIRPVEIVSIPLLAIESVSTTMGSRNTYDVNVEAKVRFQMPDGSYQRNVTLFGFDLDDVDELKNVLESVNEAG
jgi:hypothetical protein